MTDIYTSYSSGNAHCNQCTHYRLEEHGSQLWDCCTEKGMINGSQAWKFCSSREWKERKINPALMR